MAYASSESTGGASRPTSSIISPQLRSRSRAQSISSDRPSNGGNALMSPPMSIAPEAAYIAASAASQIVTNDHDNHANQWYDQHGIEPSGETAMVSVAALQLVNNFLDQLLFGFLSIARSTSLSALRPAVTEVLKPKLAKDAINQADEELREYLGGGDDEDMLHSQDSLKDWDLELVWKRTRLRCMVYSSLGDMEEEDEDFYMEHESLDGGDEGLGETVSPAVAIFLTSILEFMGEQALTSAGQAAFHRLRFLMEKAQKDASDESGAAPVAERITVDEVDMERVAFDRTIGRLWRVWKKRIRSPNTDAHAFQPRSMDMVRTATSQQRDSLDSIAIGNAISKNAEAKDGNNLAAPARSEHPASTASLADVKSPATTKGAAAPVPTPIIVKNEDQWLTEAVLTPLPVNETDVADLLFPGTAAHSDNEGEASAIKRQRKSRRNDPTRPKSLMIFSPSFMAGLPTPTFSEPRTPEFLVHRKRANSLPTPSTSPYTTPTAKRVKPSEKEEEEAKTETDTKTAEPEAVAAIAEPGAAAVVAEPEVKAEEVNAASQPATRASTDMMAPSLKERKKHSLPLPLQITMIGTAITTSAPRAIPMTSMKTDAAPNQDEGDEIDDFTEEPQILTSARVSISGRSNSPTVSESSRPVSTNIGSMPVRSPSIHSLRVIEVTSPRSPVARSRAGSSEFNEFVGVPRASNASRASSSISSQPIAEESTDVHAPRPSSLGITMVRSHTSQTSRTSESISETEEDYAETERKVLPAPSAPREHFDDMTAQLPSEPAVFSSSARRSSTSPVHPPSSRASPTSRATVAGPSTGPRTFFLDDKPEGPAKSLPERSPKRQSVPTAAAAAPAAATGITATTGLSAPGPRSGEPSSPSLATDRSSFSSSRENQARDQIRAQIRADAEAAGRKPSVASISSAISKLVPKRSSEDENAAMRPEDVARNFEELIHSDQTIQYTLTPEGMRDMDSTLSIHESSGLKGRKSDDANSQARSRSSSLNVRGENKRSTSVVRPPPLDLRVAETSNARLGGGPSLSPRSIAPSTKSMPSKARGSISQAREARVPRESMADFADFIRESGPQGASANPLAMRSNPPMTGSVSNAVRNMSSSMSMSKKSIESSKASTFSNRTRYQAREATVDKDDNSDLIDFIRRGPPSETSNPRIPRTVAPFRSTMDSDLMTSAVGGRAVDASIPDVRYSGASTNITDSSMGSGAGLIKRGSTAPVGGMYGGMPDSMPGSMPDSMPNGMPQRKTRRVRDPYAIDISDEDEDEEFDDIIAPIGGGPVRRRPPPPKEESLIDFLNSVPPPSERPPVPFSGRAPPPAPKKKASAPSLMSRFTRRSSVSANHSSRKLVSSSGQSTSNSIFDARSIASRAGSVFSGRNHGHIPIQVNIPTGYDKYGSPIGAAPPVSSNSPVAAGSGRVPMRKVEPREAASVSSHATQDLAEFFRNSGPPQSFRG